MHKYAENIIEVPNKMSIIYTPGNEKYIAELIDLITTLHFSLDDESLLDWEIEETQDEIDALVSEMKMVALRSGMSYTIRVESEKDQS